MTKKRELPQTGGTYVRDGKGRPVLRAPAAAPEKAKPVSKE